jgi:hypothetical protein
VVGAVTNSTDGVTGVLANSAVSAIALANCDVKALDTTAVLPTYNNSNHKGPTTVTKQTPQLITSTHYWCLQPSSHSLQSSMSPSNCRRFSANKHHTFALAVFRLKPGKHNIPVTHLSKLNETHGP